MKDSSASVTSLLLAGGAFLLITTSLSLCQITKTPQLQTPLTPNASDTSWNETSHLWLIASSLVIVGIFDELLIIYQSFDYLRLPFHAQKKWGTFGVPQTSGVWWYVWRSILVCIFFRLTTGFTMTGIVTYDGKPVLAYDGPHSKHRFCSKPTYYG